MTSIFAPLEEAFQGEVVMLPGEKTKKKKSKERQFETFVPMPLQSTPDPDRPAPFVGAPPPLKGPVQAQVVKLESQGATHDLFPLPGNTAEPEEWQRAFMLGDSGAAAAVSSVPPRYVRPNGAAPVDGQPTLWRQVASPIGTQSSQNSPIAVPVDVSARLDQLTRQLESLTTGTPMQSTAELFLFVAIGLLLLLAVDTLLRFSASLAQRKQMGGGGGFATGAWRPAVRYGGGRTWRIR
jgi:hypothetical protein